MVMRIAAVTVFASVLAAAAWTAHAKPETVLEAPIATKVTAFPISFDRDDEARVSFGKLRYRGGLNLFGRSSHFGGYSAIAIDPSGGALLALSDAGTWMRAQLSYDGRWLKGFSDAVLGPILGQNGQPLRTVAEQDSEALALATGTVQAGQAYVGFERSHRIMRYPFTTKRFGPPNGTVPLPKAARSMSANLGLEAVALIRAGRLKGTILAFSERLKDRNGNLIGWLIGGPAPGMVVVQRLGEFDITDATGLPDGGLILLERRFRYSEGVKMRIRRIRPSEIGRGKLIKGEVLLEATDRLNIDNMEAVAVHRSRAGETILTLMSDDNFNPFQRTLIMQFAMP